MFDKDYFREISTESWETFDYLGLEARRLILSYQDRPHPEPKEAKEIRLAVWEKKLLERMEIQKREKPYNAFKILSDEGTGVNSLYDVTHGKDRIMWAGTTVNYIGHEFSDKRRAGHISGCEMNYSEWVACQDPAFTKVFEKEGLPIPCAGLGVCVLLEITGIIPASRRDLKTPVYPGMLYFPGGGPGFGEPLLGSLVKEIFEETGLVAGVHYKVRDLFWVALISDTHHHGSKHQRPEVVAMLKVPNMTYLQFLEIRRNHIWKQGEREEDVWGFVPFPMSPPDLEEMIHIHYREMCPPAFGGFVYGLFEFARRSVGHDHARPILENFVENLKKYKAAPFEVPIVRVA